MYSKFLKTEIKHLAKEPTFIHHKWFVRYHLEIVEKIALELCDKYHSADKELVLLLVWFHDYGKIVNYADQYESTLVAGREKLLELGLQADLVEKIISYMKIFDAKEGLQSAPIEVQIVSSADAASHLVGPTYMIFWKEFYTWSYEDLLTENKRKLLVDWEKKMVLPEVRKAFAERHKKLLEQFGNLPENYLID